MKNAGKVKTMPSKAHCTSPKLSQAIIAFTDKRIQTDAPMLLYRIPAQPPPHYRLAVAVVVIDGSRIIGAASSLGRNFVDFGGWSFLFGPSNTHYSSAWWFIDGRIRFAPHDAGREISTGVSGSVLAMQGRSRIWHGPCDDGYAICWENVFLGGDTNAAANAQIIMKDNGWFETWSNEVGRVYKSIN